MFPMYVLTSIIASVGFQDGLGWDDVIGFCAGATTVITFFVLIFRPVVREWRDFVRWWRKFERDWDGVPGDDGHAEIPGVMARLNRIDGELHRNGGSSLKDQMVHVKETVDRLDDRVTTIEQRQCDIQTVQMEMAERIKDRDV